MKNMTLSKKRNDLTLTNCCRYMQRKSNTVYWQSHAIYLSDFHLLFYWDNTKLTWYAQNALALNYYKICCRFVFRKPPPTSGSVSADVLSTTATA